MNIGSVAQRLLLISNSTLYGSGYLDHSRERDPGFFGGHGVRRLHPLRDV